MPAVSKSRWEIVVVATLFFFAGCSKQTPPAASPPVSGADDEGAPSMPPPQQPQTGSETEGEQESDQAMSGDIEAALASLSAEDRALAEKQKICPVGGGLLGSMGAPLKVSVAGHDVFICCEHCEAPLKQDSAKYLAKLGLKPETATVP